MFLLHTQGLSYYVRLSYKIEKVKTFVQEVVKGINGLKSIKSRNMCQILMFIGPCIIVVVEE